MTNLTLTNPLLRYHGGKWRIAPWIIEQFPPHRVYVEPFGGGASVLCRKAVSAAEVYNDLDGEIVNVFRVLRDPCAAARLAELCRLTPYARAELELTQEPTQDPAERARRTLFRAWASFGSAGATRGRTGFRTYTNPDTRYTSPTESWSRLPESIQAFSERFRGVIIENRPALDVIEQHDTEQTLHYVDPPYLPETRAFDGGRYYRHEMTEQEHIALLELLQDVRGMVVLSGYPSDLYDEHLKGWQRLQRITTASSQHGSSPRIECLWLNPAAVENQRQRPLFANALA